MCMLTQHSQGENGKHSEFTEKGKSEQVTWTNGHLPHGEFDKTEVNDKVSYFEEQSQCAGRGMSRRNSQPRTRSCLAKASIMSSVSIWTRAFMEWIHFEESKDSTVIHRKEAGLGAHGNLLNTGVFEKAETRTYHENGEIIQKDSEASKQGKLVGRVTFGDKEQLLKGITLTKKRADGKAYSEIHGLPYRYLRAEAAAAGIADANGVLLPPKSSTPGVSGPASEAVAAARATVNVGHHQIVAGIGKSFKNGVSEKVYSRVEQTTKEKQGYGVISATNGKKKMDIVTSVEKAFTSSESVVGG